MRSMNADQALASVESVRAELDRLANAEPADWPAEAVRSALPSLLTALNQLTAVVALVVGSFDGRELAQVDGLRTTRTWLTAFGRMSQGSATAWLVRARLLRLLPALASRAVRGLVPVDNLRPIADLVQRVGPAGVVPFDDILAGLASAAGPADVAAACARIAAHVDPDGPDPDPAIGLEQRCLTLSRSGSMVLVRGQLDLAGGASVLTALDAVMQPPGPDDARTQAQRRADALTELAERALQSGDLPTVQGERPHLGVLITPTTLMTPPARFAATTLVGALPDPGPPVGDGGVDSHDGEASDDRAADASADDGEDAEDGDRCPAAGSDASHWQDRLTAAGVPPLPESAWLSWVGDIPTAIAQRISCDCQVWRAVLDPLTGLPLEVGRTHRTVPHWIRKALHARDRGCRWPGCTAAAAWTDAHHLLAWYHGGETNIDNLLSLCRWHHGKVHEGRWRIRLDPATGAVHVTRPDGRPYELGPSRPFTGPSRRSGEEPS